MDYKNAKIYTVRSHQTDLVYVGSTCSPLHKRLSQHKKASQSSLKTTVQAILRFGDAYIELHEEFPCDNVEQLRKREGEVIRSINCVNKRIEGRTKEEWNKQYYLQNRQQLNAVAKQWAEDNKEHVQELNRQSYEKNKDKVLERSKVHYEKNKEKRIAQQTKRYEQKKDEINKKVMCMVCQCLVSKPHMLRHHQTPKHIKWFIWH